MTMLVMLGYAVDQDPGPVLLVQSSMGRGQKLQQEPPAASTGGLHGPCQAQDRRQVRLFSGGNGGLDTCSIYLQGAGNPAQLASRPIRYLLADEVDKWPDESKKEADALSLGHGAHEAFPNHKAVLASTPTIARGLTWQAFKAGDQRRYHVPCPAAGHFFVLQWQQVKWPEASAAKAVVDQTWLECPHCQGAITE